MARFQFEPRAVVIGLSTWKDFISDWIPGKNVIKISKKLSYREFLTRIVFPAFFGKTSVYVWGYKHPIYVEKYCRLFGVPFFRIEDGFIRSIKLGATKAPPISLCFDRRGMHFDPEVESDLEDLIKNYPFSDDVELLARASRGITRLKEYGLSKYNIAPSVDINKIYGEKTTKRILVIGQVDNDMSIVKGCKRNIDSNGLVRMAHQEHPGAQIIYKPHPEVLLKLRYNSASATDVSDIALTLEEHISMHDAFETIDHVYTITSLSGFEALLYGKKVTCVGSPFYSGWGLTDDRQLNKRRQAKRTVEELFAASYLLYPKYFNPYTKTQIMFEDAVDLLLEMRADFNSKDRGSSQALYRPDRSVL